MHMCEKAGHLQFLSILHIAQISYGPYASVASPMEVASLQLIKNSVEIVWPVAWLAGWLVGWLAGCLIVRFVGWSFACLLARSLACFGRASLTN